MCGLGLCWNFAYIYAAGNKQDALENAPSAQSASAPQKAHVGLQILLLSTADRMVANAADKVERASRCQHLELYRTKVIVSHTTCLNCGKNIDFITLAELFRVPHWIS